MLKRENVKLIHKYKERKKSPMISFTIDPEFWVPGMGRKKVEGALILSV